uniref:F-box domain-containing protein n=1 Tax=Opuntia streptacantha TaxID=393608 RepID=A0A7C8Z0Y8_OPUST
MDRISDLPDNVVEMIIERLPLRDAARTSTLSKKWQYKWAMLSTLCLDYIFFDTMYRQRRKPPVLIYPSLVKTILLQHTGHLQKFVIYIPNLDASGIGEINLTIRVALMNGVQELTVIKAEGCAPHALPSFLFVCAEQITKLEFTNCVLNPPLEFRGFPNLKTLHLNAITCSSLERLSNFISSCPRLQRITLSDLNKSDQQLYIHAPSLEVFSVGGAFRSILFQEAQNLVSLKIFLADINEGFEKVIPCNDYMLQLFSKLSKIKCLKLEGYICMLLGADYVQGALSIELDNLKTIEAVSVDLGDLREFHCLLRLIRSAPNLQKVEITAFRDEITIGRPCFRSDAGDYGDCNFRNLQSVRINELMGTKAELKMIEILLRHSPVLKVLSIQVESKLDKDAKLEVSKELMRFCRASPTAQILCTYDEVKA